MIKRKSITFREVTSTVSTRLALALAVAGTYPALVHAQGRAAIEEVVVTAEHREASLQDTQISITALSADDIQQMGISNVGDIDHFIPNVTLAPMQSGRTGFGINMRGIGEFESLITFDPAVGMYVDDVLISKNTGSLLDVLDIQRMEVLRGPQGTLYGRNTMGGTVNIVTQRPSGELGGSLEATLGNYNQRDLRGMLNLPLLGPDSALGELNMKVSAATLNRDGLQDNVAENAPQDELGTRDREVVMAQFAWQPTDDLNVMYSYDRTRIDEIPEVVWVTFANPDSRFGGQQIPFEVGQDRPDDIRINSVNIAQTDVDGHSLHIDYALSDALTFKSITAQREMENTSAADTDGSTNTLTGTFDYMTYDFFSQEFRLLGAAFDDRLNYTMGLFYMEEEGFMDSNTVIFGTPSTRVAEFDNNNWALYGQATYALTERMDLTAGIRYTEEEREMSKFDVSRSGEIVPFPDASGDFDNISPMVSLSYHWSDDIMTYAKVSTGFQSGGFNARDTTPADFLRGFEEETLMAYEVGIKSTFDDRIRFNGALWFSDYDDKKVNVFNPETLGNTASNAGVVEIYGMELEVLAQLGDYWQLGAAYGYVHPEYVEYDAPDPDNPGEFIDRSDITNFPFTPEHEVSVNLTYEYPLDFALLRARVDWSYQDDMTFLAPQPEPNSQEAYDVWHARLTLDQMAGPGDSNIRVSAWVKNLTDEGYWVSGVNSFNTAIGFAKNLYGEPRTFGVDLAIDF